MPATVRRWPKISQPFSTHRSFEHDRNCLSRGYQPAAVIGLLSGSGPSLTRVRSFTSTRKRIPCLNSSGLTLESGRSRRAVIDGDRCRRDRPRRAHSTGDVRGSRPGPRRTATAASRASRDGEISAAWPPVAARPAARLRRRAAAALSGRPRRPPGRFRPDGGAPVRPSGLHLRPGRESTTTDYLRAPLLPVALLALRLDIDAIDRVFWANGRVLTSWRCAFDSNVALLIGLPLR